MSRRSFQQGDIVWVRVADQRGFIKRRPAIVLSPTHAITRDGTAMVVAVTTTLPAVLSDDFVELPWDLTGKSASKLQRRSAAKCDWVREVPVDDCEWAGGQVLKDTIRKILVAIDRYRSRS